MSVICFYNLNEENGYLSNWYTSSFEVDKITFSSMEEFMMYNNAICFYDEAIATNILATDDVAEIKALGRQVSNYGEHIWSVFR